MFSFVVFNQEDFRLKLHVTSCSPICSGRADKYWRESCVKEDCARVEPEQRGKSVLLYYNHFVFLFILLELYKNRNIVCCKGFPLDNKLLLLQSTDPVFPPVHQLKGQGALPARLSATFSLFKNYFCRSLFWF